MLARTGKEPYSRKQLEISSRSTKKVLTAVGLLRVEFTGVEQTERSGLLDNYKLIFFVDDLFS